MAGVARIVTSLTVILLPHNPSSSTSFLTAVALIDVTLIDVALIDVALTAITQLLGIVTINGNYN